MTRRPSPDLGKSLRRWGRWAVTAGFGLGLLALALWITDTGPGWLWITLAFPSAASAYVVVTSLFEAPDLIEAAFDLSPDLSRQHEEDPVRLLMTINREEVTAALLEHHWRSTTVRVRTTNNGYYSYARRGSRAKRDALEHHFRTLLGARVVLDW